MRGKFNILYLRDCMAALEILVNYKRKTKSYYIESLIDIIGDMYFPEKTKSTCRRKLLFDQCQLAYDSIKEGECNGKEEDD